MRDKDPTNSNSRPTRAYAGDALIEEFLTDPTIGRDSDIPEPHAALHERDMHLNPTYDFSATLCAFDPIGDLQSESIDPTICTRDDADSIKEGTINSYDRHIYRDEAEDLCYALLERTELPIRVHDTLMRQALSTPGTFTTKAEDDPTRIFIRDEVVEQLDSLVNQQWKKIKTRHK